MATKLKNPIKLQCKNCKDIICSTRGGDWVSCKCFENKEGNKGIFMDRCRWSPEIYRIGGSKENYDVVGGDE